ncbi:hypothetical protein HYFRA_00007238 [Hymenoscyphus fraxineus]|uniref:Uncharacterized protein n=1 Tax=Hymenoscyphus fraxineus TaxID=746836 RepID=A0A9N9PV50_9HELO|nr:hypothetical protein HYFRA_00007238 [Hymenoscyphus fraxineus]
MGAIELSGNLSNVSFPSLQNLKHLTVTSPSNNNNPPTKINLSALRTIDDLNLTGNIKSISLDSLTYFKNIHIISSASLNCTPIYDLYTRIRKGNSGPGISFADFSCYSYKSTTYTGNDRSEGRHVNERKKTGEIMGIVFGGITFVMGVVLIGALVRRRRKDILRRGREGEVMEIHDDLRESREGDGESLKDPPPPYHEVPVA